LHGSAEEVAGAEEVVDVQHEEGRGGILLPGCHMDVEELGGVGVRRENERLE
jgi:hypothetical protein